MSARCGPYSERGSLRKKAIEHAGLPQHNAPAILSILRTFAFLLALAARAGLVVGGFGCGRTHLDRHHQRWNKGATVFHGGTGRWFAEVHGHVGPREPVDANAHWPAEEERLWRLAQVSFIPPRLDPDQVDG
ncbi:hypothetical protein [Sphingobium lactosutens]|uniref:hypothetical protein n=1 Tax=Sphingobium lactosutens TaxID=522773 RepID=UPI0015C088BA|nr:hypothetical protein [Sphingobium lactosutens]